MAWLVLVSLGLVAYSYAGYPVVLLLLAGMRQVASDLRFVAGKSDRRGGSRAGGEEDLPSVAIVISAYNEERHISPRIANVLALDYPRDKLRLYVGSDGSRDATAARLEEVTDPRVVALPFAQNRGKSSVLNDLVGRVTEPVVVFSDANTYFRPDALKRLCVHFNDPAVGAVSGELRLLGSAGDNQDSLYWRVEQALKFFEGRIGALLGANGAIYAIRRSAWQPLPPDTICDDFVVAMRVAAGGGKLVYEPRAIADEDTPPGIDDEVKRRIRIGIGNFQALFRYPEFLWRAGLARSFCYLSHKVLRWIAPHLLLLALAGSTWLAWRDGGAWLWLAAVQWAGYAACALVYSRGAGKVPGFLRLPVFFFALNWAFLVASFRYASGKYSGTWGRTAR